MTTPRNRVLRAWHDERGAATTELVVTMPALLLLIMLICHVAVWAHASNIAHTTATSALASTRVQGAGTGDGHRQANALLNQLGDGPLRDAQVTVDRQSTRATVMITGTATPVVPFLDLPVRAHADGPVERFIPVEAP